MTIQLNKKQLPLLMVLLTAVAVVLFKLVNEDFCIDEIVEYYFSQSFSGKMPTSVHSTMYDRVICTFQPPLYNVVMRLWLAVSHNLIWFRLLGMFLILGSTIGIYKAVKVYTGSLLWACATAMFYIFIPAVMHYAVEAAEYNLMIFFNAWAVYFFARCLKFAAPRDIIGFVACCILALYSQYGAAISSVGMGLALLFFYIQQHEKQTTRTLLIATSAAILFAVIPLYIWFTKVQIASQHQAFSSYTPYFYKGSLLIDFLYSPRHLCQYLFGDIPWMQILGIPFTMSGVLLIFRKNTRNIALLSAVFISWFITYWLFVYGIYGRNPWNEQYGASLMAQRYTLFITPLFTLASSAGLKILFDFIKNKKAQKTTAIILTTLLLAACARNATEFHNRHYRPLHMDEVVDLWINNADHSIPTFIHFGNRINFYFVLSNRPDYSPDMLNSVNYFHLNNEPFDIFLDKSSNQTYLIEKEFYTIIGIGDEICQSFLKTLPKTEYSVEILYKRDFTFYHVRKLNAEQ